MGKRIYPQSLVIKALKKYANTVEDTKAIADECGVSTSTIHSWARKAGVTRQAYEIDWNVVRREVNNSKDEE